jgi:hypothetical protein
MCYAELVIQSNALSIPHVISKVFMGLCVCVCVCVCARGMWCVCGVCVCVRGVWSTCLHCDPYTTHTRTQDHLMPHIDYLQSDVH